KILAIDDDKEILKLMKTALEIENYHVITCQEIELPIVFDDFKGYDLILLDIMMPNISGTEFCYKIREEVHSPIIFVSALDGDNEIVQALNIGGDDFIVKPFSLKQFVAKVNSHLKREERAKIKNEAEERVKRSFPPIEIYLEERMLYIDKQPLFLTYREYEILELLSRHPYKVFTKEEIYEQVYSDEASALFHSISEYIYQIRMKFSSFGINPIKTIRGIGYKWDV
ncbi:TPA: response regulator transcription factor, partial [Streptococcus pyogenes]|nr:response regulator transcription factor [Streptococcus pyogenes]HEP2564300.1 response regulator transcription factor [Streptococcus pyogenes]HEP2758450.1 response regulator transcription factor [Streptococcus pyogenes]HEP2772295.1 response regulator transcription factor [Streptococcus pyogenes]HEP2813781.1 response regulator transcription factor [Streptococcus pyogenes]